jgi:L-iditol 2-dehydrogenase
VAIEPANSCGRCRWCLAGRQNVCPDVAFLGAPPTHGALQEYIAYPAHLCELLPESLSDEAGVMMEPMGVAMHAINLAYMRPGMDVVILGTGVIGTCILALLVLQPDMHVICVDLLPERLERAKAMGATTVQARPGQIAEVAEAVLADMAGIGADVVFECAGADETQWNMCEIAAPVAHLLAVGTNRSDRITFCAGTARRLGLTIRVVRRSLNTLSRCIDLADRRLIQPDELVTHTFPASQVAEAFETAANHANGVLKAIVDMREW